LPFFSLFTDHIDKMTIKCPPELLKKSIKGKKILITGGYGGIGLQTATQLISQGGEVIIAGRDAVKGETVAKKIGATFMQLDLGNRESIVTFCTKFNKENTSLDILVNNAGVMCPGKPDTAPGNARTLEGWEIQMGVNHLGHALLTHHLTPLLVKTDSSRIVFLSSCAADSMPGMGGQEKQADIDFNDPHWKSKEYVDIDAYGQSKLANILHARELAERLNKDGVTVVSLHPGWVNTNLFRFAPAFVRYVLFPLMGPCLGLLSVKAGSDVSLYCCLGDIENGKFYSQVGIYGNKSMQGGGLPMEFVSPNATTEKQKALWDWTMKELGIEEDRS